MITKIYDYATHILLLYLQATKKKKMEVLSLDIHTQLLYVHAVVCVSLVNTYFKCVWDSA